MFARRVPTVFVALVSLLYHADETASFHAPHGAVKAVVKDLRLNRRPRRVADTKRDFWPKLSNDDNSIVASNDMDVLVFSNETSLFNDPTTWFDAAGFGNDTIGELGGDVVAVKVNETTKSNFNDTIGELGGAIVAEATESNPTLMKELSEKVTLSEADATEVTATSKEEEPPVSLEAPSVKKVFRFAIPAVGVWLCSPLLSLIDTSAVGLLSGTAQQAALNPAVAVTDYGSLLVAFVYTATTNLVAAAQQSDANVEGKPKTTQTLIAALQLATFVGIACGASFGVFSKFFMKTIIGNEAIDPVVFSAALRYCRIRALGLPAAVVIGSAQAACLGMQDIKSPLYVLLAAAVVNFCGDLLFVGNINPLVGGAAGAAWATVFSQYAALAMFLAWLQKKPNEPNSKTATTKSGALTTRGFLANKFRKRDLFKFPAKEMAKKFSPYVIPVTTTAIGRVSGYIAMSHVASSSLGMTDMAAQQILLAFFLCFTPICDSLNLTAQSFVPGIFEQKLSRTRTSALKKTVRNFVKAGSIMGAILLGVVSFMPLFSRFFTLDAAVSSKVAAATPALAAIFALSGIVCAGEGLLLGQKDLGFLGKSYAAYFFVVPYFLLRLKKAAASGLHNVGVASMWKVFLVYQSIRCSMWLARLRLLHRRREEANRKQATEDSPAF